MADFAQNGLPFFVGQVLYVISDLDGTVQRARVERFYQNSDGTVNMFLKSGNKLIVIRDKELIGEKVFSIKSDAMKKLEEMRNV